MQLMPATGETNMNDLYRTIGGVSNNPKDAVAFYIDDFVDPNINKAQRSHGHYIRQVFK